MIQVLFGNSASSFLHLQQISSPRFLCISFLLRYVMPGSLAILENYNSNCLTGQAAIGGLVLFILVSRSSDYQQQKRKQYKVKSSQHIQMLKEQSEGLSVKNRFIATLAHEIRNIVTKQAIYSLLIVSSIVTNANFLKEAGVWNNEVVSELAEASEVLSEILNNTLDISKLEEGKIEFNKKYESIRSVVDAVLNVSKANAQKKDIKLQAQYEPSLPQLLEFDKARVTQIIMNLVGNAIKFTPSKGIVTVKAGWSSGAEQPKATISQEKAKEDAPVILVNGDQEKKKDFSTAIKETPKKDVFKDMAQQRVKNMRAFSSQAVSLFGVRSNSPETPEKVPDEINAEVPPKEKVEKHALLVHFHRRSLGGTTVRNVECVRRNLMEHYPVLQTEIEETKVDLLKPALENNKDCEGLPENVRYCTDKHLNEAVPSPSVNSSIDKRHSPDKINLSLFKLGKTSKDFRMSSYHLDVGKQSSQGQTCKSRQPRRSRRQHQSRQFSLRRAVTMNADTPEASYKASNITQEGNLVITVSDTGCGMTKEEKARLFQPFSQTNKGVYTKFGGTGLGLWLCHKLITAMKGTISCDSIKDKGTTFTISLPVKYKANESPVYFLSPYYITIVTKNILNFQGPHRNQSGKRRGRNLAILEQIWLQNNFLPIIR
eukprot:TRINITY_DN71223_c0_g1_i1.p1 TRINITY_DN71223_c0_g1~~TRINITY_DN71223_c0_g1_i1.p1  ORF type:complete len:656 (-),score=51.21 TRINITY_DN71223_c0_g1_i1:2595-4562(-)